MPDAGPYNLVDQLNHCMPVAKKANLGTLLQSLITACNAILAKLDATGAMENATGTVTVGGSITGSDTLSVTITNPLMAALPVVLGPINVGTLDTTTTLATDIMNLVNNSAPLAAGSITATSTAAVVHIAQPGVIGNLTVITDAKSVGATETLTLANSGTLVGGVGTFGNGNSAALAIPLIQV